MIIGKVLLVSGSANFSTRDVWDGYRIGLEVAGIEVLPYPTFSMLKVLSIESVCSDIIGTALDVEHGIDCVIFVDGLYFRGDRSRVPLSIKQAGIPTVLIATDDPYEVLGPTASNYQYTFSNEKQSADDDHFYLPTATLPPPALPQLEAQPYDLSFLGTIFDDRLPFLIELARFCETRQLRMVIAGKFVSDPKELQQFANVELRSRTIDAAEKWELYAQSKVTINLFRESEIPAASPSPRVFEVTGYGHCGLLTGPARSEVERIYGDSVYHFQDLETAKQAIDEALSDPAERAKKLKRAYEITHSENLYHHRASQLVATLRDLSTDQTASDKAEHRLAWLVGFGRSGSTWLADMLGSLPRITRWHEPYFGRLFRHVHDRPDELDRPGSFYTRRHQRVLTRGVRELFFQMAQARFPTFGEHALVVKEVNTPELYPWLGSLFPTSKLIFLTRDPFDSLDSFLDLQAPGSWNEEFGDSQQLLSEQNVTRTCEYIRESALAAAEAFESFPEKQRLRIDYADLLSDPGAALTECGNLLEVEVKPGVATQIAEQNRFERQTDTGPGKFRRKGKAGVWKESAYFTPEVTEIAERILGPIRTRLGYAE